MPQNIPNHVCWPIVTLLVMSAYTGFVSIVYALISSDMLPKVVIDDECGIFSTAIWLIILNACLMVISISMDMIWYYCKYSHESTSIQYV